MKIKFLDEYTHLPPGVEKALIEQKPVFTTSRPGAFADTSDRNQEFIDSMDGPRKLFTKNLYNVYIDGELENIVGYDIPIWLSGTITGETQDCTVYSVDGTESYEAEITYGHSTGHTYIRLKELKT